MSYDIQTIDTHVDLLKVLLWQYNSNDNESVEGLLKSKSEWYELYVSGFWESWYADVFDIRTANEFGLTVWAIILGVSFEIPDCPNKSLNLEQKRLVIRLRFYQITTRATIPMVNAELLDVFGEGAAYALDPLDMSSITYVFRQQPSPDVALVLSKYDLLPRPSAVGVTYRVETNLDVFGFGEYNQNFENGAFYAGDVLISYDWDLTIQYDNSTGLVSGTLGSGDTTQGLSGYHIAVTYTNKKTDEKITHDVVTDSQGVWVDKDTPQEDAWTVTAKTQIDTPICTTIDVQSPTIEYNRIVYKFGITGAFDSDAKQVSGTLSCNQDVNLSGQSVVISYAPDAANGEGAAAIQHTVITTSGGTYVDPNTPDNGRYTTTITCHIVLPAEDVSADVSVDPFEFTNIEYVYGLTIAFDDASKSINGTLSVNHPLPSVNNVSVRLFYYDRTGSHNKSKYVRTDADGNYTDPSPPVGYDYAVFATVQIQGPFEPTQQTVVSDTIRFQIVYTYALEITYNDNSGTISGQIIASGGGGLANQLVKLIITNSATAAQVVHQFETADDGTFTDDQLPGGGTFTAVAQCDFVPPYGGTIALISNTVGFSSITPGAQVKMIIANVSQVMFCIAASELDNIEVDYGDGNGPGKNFRSVDATATLDYLAILPPTDFKVDSRTQWTVTISNSHTVRFINTTGADKMTFCRLTELIYVASNSRKTCYLLAPYSNLNKIHEKAFAGLPNCETSRLADRLHYLRVGRIR